jgi:nucleoside-diphosphate-sugar epimerase
MSRSALLTGVTGFIGGKLARRLADDGWDVHVITRPSSEGTADYPRHLYDGSLSSLVDAVQASRPDVVFHLASLYLAGHKPDQVEDLVASNILLPVQLAEAMVGAGVTRLVNTGTAWQQHEGAAYNPVNLYAATKQACTDLLRFYHEALGLSVITLKLFDTYGAGDKRRKLVQLLVEAAASGQPLGMSPGEQILDLTHVDDVVDAFRRAAELILEADRPRWDDYLVSGERFSVRALADEVGHIFGSPVRAEFGARPYRAREVMVPIEPGPDQMLPGWAPRRRLRVAAREIAWSDTMSREVQR